jgi:hypothetical protein
MLWSKGPTVDSEQCDLLVVANFISLQITNFLIRIPSGFSSTITCDGFSNPLRRAISMGITSVALDFPVRNVLVTSFISDIIE